MRHEWPLKICWRMACRLISPNTKELSGIMHCHGTFFANFHVDFLSQIQQKALQPTKVEITLSNSMCCSLPSSLTCFPSRPVCSLEFVLQEPGLFVIILHLTICCTSYHFSRLVNGIDATLASTLNDTQEMLSAIDCKYCYKATSKGMFSRKWCIV